MVFSLAKLIQSCTQIFSNAYHTHLQQTKHLDEANFWKFLASSVGQGRPSVSHYFIYKIIQNILSQLPTQNILFFQITVHPAHHVSCVCILK